MQQTLLHGQRPSFANMKRASPWQRAKVHTHREYDWRREVEQDEEGETYKRVSEIATDSWHREKKSHGSGVATITLHKNDDAQSQQWGMDGIINKTLAYPMSQSTVSLRYSGSFSSLKSLWGEENNTENDEVGKEEGRRPPKVAFFTSSVSYHQPVRECSPNFLYERLAKRDCPNQTPNCPFSRNVLFFL